MELIVKSGFRGISLSTREGPIKVKMNGFIRSIQRCSSVNAPEYMLLEVELEDDTPVRSIEESAVVAVATARDEVFLKTMRLKMSEEDVHDFFRPFRGVLTVFPGREGKDQPIVFGENDATLDYQLWKEYIDQLADDQTKLTFELKCQRIWSGSLGTWGLGWDLVGAAIFLEDNDQCDT